MAIEHKVNKSLAFYKHFQVHSCESFFFVLWFQFWLIAFLWLKWQYVIIGSGNDFLPNKQQVITRASDDQVLGCHMASLGHKELNIFICRS